MKRMQALALAGLVMVASLCLVKSSIAQINPDPSDEQVVDIEAEPDQTTVYPRAGMATTAPATPSRLSVRLVSNSSVLIRWQDNSNNETGFDVQRLVATNFYKTFVTVKPNRTRITVTGLAPGTRHCFGVQAVNGRFVSKPATLSPGEKWNCVITPK